MSHDSTTAPAGERFRRACLWGAVLGLTLALAAGAVAAIASRPIYEASSWLLVKPTYVVFGDQKLEGKDSLETHLELVRSPPVLLEALADPKIAELPMLGNVNDPVAFLHERIVVGQVGRSKLFTIGLRSHSQESVAPIVNSVRDAYVSFISSPATDEDQQLLTLLNNEQRRKRTEIETLQERVKALARAAVANGKPIAFANVSEASPAAFNPVAALNEKLHESDFSILSLQTEYELAKATIAKQDPNPTPAEVEAWIDQQLDVAPLLAAIANARATAESDFASEKRRDGARITLVANEEALKRLRRDVRSKAEAALNEARAERNAASLASIAKELQTRTEEKKILEARLKVERSKVQSVSDAGLEFEFMAKDLQREKAVADSIAKRIRTIETESRALSDVMVLAEAQTPAAPIDAWPTRNIATASVAGFAAPFLLLTLWSGAGSALAFIRRKRARAADQEPAQE